MPLAQDVAVRLVVVGGDACAQPVHLVVAGQGHVVELADGLEGQARLASRSLELAHLRRIRMLQWNSGEGRVESAAGGRGAVHGFSRQEAAGGRERDALVAQRFGTGDFLLDRGCLIGDRGSQRGLCALQVGDAALEGGHCCRVVAHRLLLAGSGGLCFGCRGLGGSCRLLGHLQLRVLFGQVGLQAVDLALHLLAQRLNLFFNRRRSRRHNLSGFDALPLRRFGCA